MEQRYTSVDHAAQLLSRSLHVERRDRDGRAQRDALAAHYGILSSDLAGISPGALELMTLRVRAERLDEKAQIAEELREALIPWLFRIGVEVRDVAELLADKPVVDRLVMCVAELDDCESYIRQLVFVPTVQAPESESADAAQTTENPV